MHQLTTLPNGLRVISYHLPAVESVSACIFAGVGSRYEKRDEAGICHFIEHMLFRGTERRPASCDISAAIEGIGGILNGGTDRESTVYWCKVAKDHLGDALDVLADMLFHSRFSGEDIEKERQVVIEEINMSRDNPSQWVGLMIDSLLWPGHPLGRDTAGSKKTVSAISRDMMLGYLERHYLPSNIVVAIAGGSTHHQAVAAVSKVLGNLSGPVKTSPGYRPYSPRTGKRMSVDRRDIEQVHLCLAMPGMSRLNPKRFAFDLLSSILGEGMSSRLFTEVRDRLGLAYNIYCCGEHLMDTGALTIYAGVDPKNLSKTVKAIMEQLQRLRVEFIGEDELGKAKEMTKGHILLAMEDSRSVAGWIGAQELLTGQVQTVDEVLAIIDAISSGVLRELANEYICDSGFRLALVGPVNKKGLDSLLTLPAT